MVLINDLNVIELQNVNNLNDTKEQMLDYFLHRLASLFNALGYFVFCYDCGCFHSCILIKNPMGLIKNILFCVSFFGIASLYLDEFTSMHTGNLFHKNTECKKIRIIQYFSGYLRRIKSCISRREISYVYILSCFSKKNRI